MPRIAILCLIAALCPLGLPAQAKPKPSPTLIFSLPRLAGTDAATARINVDLEKRDAKALEPILRCEGGERHVTINFISDAFLSLSTSAGGYCEGAAHPFYAETHLTYDLTTGAPLDWFTLLPTTLLTDNASKPTEPSDGFKSNAITKLYLAYRELPETNDLTFDEIECRAYIGGEPGTSFDLWLDQPNHALAIAPTGVAYIYTPCIKSVYIPMDTLRSLGADPRLIEALRSQPD